MSPLNFLLSLPTQDNDYQRYQAAAAEEAARRAGVQLRVVYANDDSVEQSEQILKAMQASDRESRPNGVIVQCVGTELRSAAELAATSGIGWVVLHREYSYRPEMRAAAKAPSLAISSDHTELGRIQGRQLAKLLPNGGTVLYITGPSLDKMSVQRLSGFAETKPPNVEVRTIRGRWTMQSGKDTLTAWLRISISLHTSIAAIVSQNDDMAMGARNALQEHGKAADLNAIPLLGIDGVPEAGQLWVKKGWLASTVTVPPLAGTAVTMLAQAMRAGTNPPENTVVGVESFPGLELLRPFSEREESLRGFARAAGIASQSPTMA